MKLCYVVYTVKEGKRGELMEKLEKGRFEEIFRSQKGNISFDFYLPTSDGNRLVLIDCWESCQDLQGHADSPEVQDYLAVLKPYVVEDHSTHYTSDQYLASICRADH